MNTPANITRLVFELIGSDDEVRVLSFSGNEFISGLFSFSLDVACENGTMTADSFLSKSGLLTLVDPSTHRLLHGEIIDAAQVNQGRRFTQFQLTVAPKPWYLQSRSGSRIFQDQSVPAIIKTVLGDAGIRGADVRFSLTPSYPPRIYCVQHQETDWDFICRLMEEEGIFYFFEHALDKHTMVIGDQNSCFRALPGGARIAYHPVTGLVPGKESLYDYRCIQGVATGKVSLQDYFFEKPSLSLLSSAAANGAGARGDFEQYHYPGCYQTPEEGKRYAQLRVDALNTFAFTATIKTNSQRLQPGYVVAIEGHPRNSANRQYLITQVHHKSQQPQSLEEGASTAAYSYQATVSLIPNDVIYRPARTHVVNKITGTETAIVTGPPGEEIYTDEHGRIKVHFHWDRNNGYDQKSSCWVRVSQAVAGEEVMIAYESGLPDRPIVIGRLYNGQHPAPYPLPANKTRSSLKTLSTPNGGGFNEVRIEDKKGNEKIFIHAEKDVDMLVKNDWRETIDNDEHHSVDKASFTKIGKDNHQTVDKQHNLSVGKSHSRQAGKDTHIKAGKNYIAQAQEIHLKAGMQLVIEAGTEVVMKAGSGLIALNPSGVTIKGAMVKINSGGGGGAAKAASPEAPVAPQAPKDDKSGKVSKAAKAKQQKNEAIALASGSAKAVQSDDIVLASVVRGPNVVSNAPLPPEQKKAEIECLRPDGSPAKGFPYQAILADGSEKKGTLDANGKASLQGVPKGSVQVTVGETVVASEVVQLRQEMTQIFQAMVAKEKADAKSLADNRSDHNILQDAMEMDFSIKKGIWKGAVGLLTWINDVKDVVHPVDILHRKLLVAWKSYSSDSEEWAATYKKNIEIADHKELVEALGFDPDKVTAEVIAEAYEITGYLFDDEASRTLIKQFAKDFAQAQDRTEWAEFAGGAIFEIVLGAVIVALTGGLGVAAVAAKSSRHVGKLTELGKVLKKLADKLKAVKLRKVKTGHTGDTVKVKLDKPSEVEFSSHGNELGVADSKNTDRMPELGSVLNSRFRNLTLEPATSRIELTGMIGGKPVGGPTSIPKGAGTEVRRGLTRENESAEIIARNGFKVDQTPIQLPNGKNPDLTIEGRVFDVLSPVSNNASQILKDVKNKTLGKKVKLPEGGSVRKNQQTRNLVVNLNDTAVTPTELQELLTRKSSSLPNLDEVIVIPKGSSDLVRFDFIGNR